MDRPTGISGMVVDVSVVKTGVPLSAPLQITFSPTFFFSAWVT